MTLGSPKSGSPNAILSTDKSLHRSQVLILVSVSGKWWATENKMNHGQMLSAEVSLDREMLKLNKQPLLRIKRVLFAKGIHCDSDFPHFPTSLVKTWNSEVLVSILVILVILFESCNCSVFLFHLFSHLFVSLRCSWQKMF